MSRLNIQRRLARFNKNERGSQLLGNALRGIPVPQTPSAAVKTARKHKRLSNEAQERLKADLEALAAGEIRSVFLDDDVRFVAAGNGFVTIAR